MMKKLLVLAALAVVMAACAKDDGWGNEAVIPLMLAGIEAVNIDNSGEFPVVSVAPIKKEAYMLGVKWIADNLPADDDKYVTGPISEGERTYGRIADGYAKAIVCLTQFNDRIPAGSYVSSYFKPIDRNYLPADVDEGFVLLVAPDAGVQAFRVEYYDGEELAFSYDTPSIEFF